MLFCLRLIPLTLRLLTFDLLIRASNLYYFTNIISNSSKDFPFVSGNNFKINNRPKKAKIPNNRKVIVVPKLANSQGKTNCTKKLTVELINPTNEIATPRILLGKSSENNTHITGPNEIANDATNPKIQNKIKVEFIVIEAQGKRISF